MLACTEIQQKSVQLCLGISPSRVLALPLEAPRVQMCFAHSQNCAWILPMTYYIVAIENLSC